MARMHLDHIDYLSDRIDELDTQVGVEIGPFQAQLDLLNSIPGIGPTVADVVVAEIGIDMSRFPTAGHLASWAGLCPGNHESAGKKRSGRARKGNRALERRSARRRGRPPTARTRTWPLSTSGSSGASAARMGVRPRRSSPSPTPSW